MDNDPKHDDLARRRELAAALGYTLREDVLTLFNLAEATEEAYRKRGTPIADYAIVGRAVLYRTASLAARLEASIRTGSRIPTRDAL